MKKIDLKDFPKCRFGKNVNIEAEHIIIKDGSRIYDNVFIQAKNIQIGYDSVIEKNTVIKGLGQEMTDFILGDNTFIGYNNQILVPYFKMLDFSQLHNNGLCSGYKPLIIGFNCWIGQNAILNSYEKLSIGNNVRMGGCQIWTHVASGEILEGCKIYGSAPVIIEDNVWLMGFGHLISPGVNIKRNSIIMAGAVITKSTEPYRTYSGIPAADITDKLNGWREVTINDKIKLLEDFIKEFVDLFPAYKDRVFICTYGELKNIDINNHSYGGGSLFFVNSILDIRNFYRDNNTYFDLCSKLYTKKRTEIEINWIKFTVGYRARFIPANYSY